MLQNRLKLSQTSEQTEQLLETYKKDPQWVSSIKSELTKVGVNTTDSNDEDLPLDQIVDRWIHYVELPRIVLDEENPIEFQNELKKLEADPDYDKHYLDTLKTQRVFLQTNKTSFLDMLYAKKTPLKKEWETINKQIGMIPEGDWEHHNYTKTYHRALNPYNNKTSIENFIDQQAKNQAMDIEKERRKDLKRIRDENESNQPKNQPPNKKPRKSKDTKKPVITFVTRDEDLKWLTYNAAWWMSDPKELKWYTLPAPLNYTNPGPDTNQRLSSTTFTTDIELNVVLPIQTTNQIWRFILVSYTPKTNREFKLEDMFTESNDTNKGSWATTTWKRNKENLVNILYDKTFYKNYDNCSGTMPKVIHIQETVPVNLESEHDETGPLNNKIMMFWRTNTITPLVSEVDDEHLPRFSYRLNFTDKFL